MSPKFTHFARLLLTLMLLFAVGIVSAQNEEPPPVPAPDELVFNLDIQAAYNESEIFWRFQWAAEDAGYYHDYLVYTDGEWKRFGDSGGGSDPLGLREDRVTFMLEPGTVLAFANQGCYVGCHDGTYTLDNAINEEQLEATGFTLSSEEVRKFIIDSRVPSGDWWDVEWDAVKTEEQLLTLREAGVFLDLWHWRAHRSNPIGYSDNQYVLEFRTNSGSRSPFKTNFIRDAGTPEFMYDPAVTGFNALNLETLLSGGYSFDDFYYISSDIAVPFDPNHNWQNGDTIPRRFLREPDADSGSILADGVWENATWTVVLRRSLDDVNAMVSHPLVEGRTYNAAFAIHRDATGSRWHYISHSHSVGIGTPADITAVHFNGASPNWSTVPTTTVPVRYPGQTTWQWLTSDAHPGASEVRDDSRSCISCHGDSYDDALKLAQASVYHEFSGESVDTNWYLTLFALITVLGGGTFAMLNLFNRRKEA